LEVAGFSLEWKNMIPDILLEYPVARIVRSYLACGEGIIVEDSTFLKTVVEQESNILDQVRSQWVIN
jgi:hypothetical protein